MNNILILILITVIMFILFKPNKNNVLFNSNIQDNRIKVFTFSPDLSNKFRMNFRYPMNKYEYQSTYISACIDKLNHNLDSRLFNLIVLNKFNIYQYLPDFSINLDADYKYTEKQVYDLIGAMILKTYGGLWLYPGTIIIDVKDLYQQLNNNDLVLFGSSNFANCDLSTPNNYIIGSKPNKTMENYVKNLKNIMIGDIKQLHSHIGTEFNPLGEAITNNVTIKHYDCLTDGTFNIFNRKMQIDDYLGKLLSNYDYEKLMFISFPYERLDIDTNYRWFKYSNIKELKYSGINLIQYLKM